MKKGLITEKDETNLSAVEKLREDLFEYRIDIKTYKRNLSTIIIAGSIVISVLAFFGFNKIETIQDSILKRANERLSITDSILSKIDQNKIDSLNDIITKKEIEYSQTIKKFENIIAINKNLEGKLLQSLPENKRTNKSVNSYITEYPTSAFEVRSFKKELRSGIIETIYLIFNEDINHSKDDFISVTIRPKGRNIILLDKHYEIHSKLNRLTCGLEKFENFEDYTLEIAYFSKVEANRYRKSYISEIIKLDN